ncbi:uncharacterized protein DNG_02384 [Cephalotrichum gorgonifer]|uniref:Uncharacterized protein n=1 Tax=Cephalotrichum gorgonifer TaxID=2041049 RepID=A0AAE8SSI4_9PEZI|nr:uncharacterized protein DNG_02384 [Cephalotrichum gorgonifer]
MSDQPDPADSSASSTPARGILGSIRSFWGLTPAVPSYIDDPFLDTPPRTDPPLREPKTEEDVFMTPRENPATAHLPWDKKSQILLEFKKKFGEVGRGDGQLAEGDFSALWAIAENFGARLGFYSPHDVIGWSVDRFRLEQTREVERLKQEKRTLSREDRECAARIRLLDQQRSIMENYTDMARHEEVSKADFFALVNERLRDELEEVEERLNAMRGRRDTTPSPTTKFHTPPREKLAEGRILHGEITASEERKVELLAKHEAIVALIAGEDPALVNNKLGREEERSAEIRGRISKIEKLLREREQSGRSSPSPETPAEVFAEQRKVYQSRISELESVVENLRRARSMSNRGSLGSNRDGDPAREKKVEKIWLEEKLTCPKTSEEWEKQVKALLADVIERDEELEEERQDIKSRAAYLDYKESELLGYKRRVEDDIRGVEASANELQEMIVNVRNNLYEEKQLPGRRSTATAEDDMVPMAQALKAADSIFKETQFLSNKIIKKVETARDTTDGFWKGKEVRSPWELIRAIKARDERITGLEEEIQELGGRVALFVRKLGQIQEAVDQITNTAERQSTNMNDEAFADQIVTLTRLITDAVSAGSGQGTGTERAYSPSKSKHTKPSSPSDGSDIVWNDEYGNVIRMAEKFRTMKSELEGQVTKLQELVDGFKASRDLALKSGEEYKNTCQQLREQIESMAAKSLREIESVVQDCELRHSKELEDHRADTAVIKEELERCKEQLLKRTAECEDLEGKVVAEKKRLMVYKTERFLQEGDLNPAVQELLKQTAKEKKALEDKVASLNDVLAALKAKNSALEQALASEKERLAAHLDHVNIVPELQKGLAKVKQAADEYHRHLKEARGEADVLKAKLQREEDRCLDFQYDELTTQGLLAKLRLELKDKAAEAERRDSEIRSKWEIEVCRLTADVTDSRNAFEELLKKYDELGENIIAGVSSARKPNKLLHTALTHNTSFLREIRELKNERVGMMSGHDYAVRQSKELQEDLARTRETELQLRDNLAAALIKTDSIQAKFEKVSVEMNVLKEELANKKQGFIQKDASRIWDDTRICVSNEVLETRIATLQGNLAKVLRLQGPSRGLAAESEYHDVPRATDLNTLLDGVQQIYSTQYPSEARKECALTRADMANFWHHNTLLDKRLALLRAIKDGDQTGGRRLVDDLNHFLQETNLGPFSDEAWGSVQYLEGYFHTHITGDIAAAEAAIRRARVHNTDEWDNKFYRDLGAKLENDLIPAKKMMAQTRGRASSSQGATQVMLEEELDEMGFVGQSGDEGAGTG